MLVAVAMGSGSFDGAEGEFTRVRQNGKSIKALYGEMRAAMISVGGDPDVSNNVTDTQTDPNDIQTGLTGTKKGCIDGCITKKKK